MNNKIKANCAKAYMAQLAKAKYFANLAYQGKGGYMKIKGIGRDETVWVLTLENGTEITGDNLLELLQIVWGRK